MIGFLRALPTRWADQLARWALGFTRRRFAAVLAAAAALLALASLPSPARADSSKETGAWQFVKRADGIVVERRSVAGSSLKEFRGSGVVQAPVAALLAVVADVPRATEWMDSCNGSRTVEDLGDREKIVYNRTHAPWPVSDRDAVLHNVVRVDAAARRLDLDFWSVSDDKAPPVSGVVRMPFLRGHWSLWPSADGQSTRVEYQVHANPGGSLPDWLVNYVSRDLPFRTIEGLRAQTRRRHYPGFANELRAKFSQYPFLWQTVAGNM
jgi:hypothetical protein